MPTESEGRMSERPLDWETFCEAERDPTKRLAMKMGRMSDPPDKQEPMIPSPGNIAKARRLADKQEPYCCDDPAACTECREEPIIEWLRTYARAHDEFLFRPVDKAANAKRLREAADALERLDDPPDKQERWRQAFCGECGKPVGPPAGNCTIPGHGTVHDRWVVPASTLAASEARADKAHKIAHDMADRHDAIIDRLETEKAQALARVRELEEKLTKQVDVNYEITRKLPTRRQALAALRKLVEASDSLERFERYGDKDGSPSEYVHAVYAAATKARALLEDA